ncbi:MAG TPA: N-acetyltransferase [Actinobacteria bacterium]|nr:N-acetyltransferase [Actinomycetota bacterium]
MALAERSLPVFLRGSWPGRVTLRRGWARAEARPWNDVVADASLRIVRGGSGFLQACTEKLLGVGAPAVLSPPLPVAARRPWLAVGYREHVRLALMRLDLSSCPAAPDHLVVDAPTDDLAPLLAVDRAAFDPRWRFDELGLREALAATPTTAVKVVRGPDGDPIAYAIVGYGQAISYLQRVAVHPRWQGRGMGRSLLRASAREARARGARALLLNTQTGNETATSLYASEGYVTLPESLAVLRFA